MASCCDKPKNLVGELLYSAQYPLVIASSLSIADLKLLTDSFMIDCVSYNVNEPTKIVQVKLGQHSNNLSGIVSGELRLHLFGSLISFTSGDDLIFDGYSLDYYGYYKFTDYNILNDSTGGQRSISFGIPISNMNGYIQPVNTRLIYGVIQNTSGSEINTTNIVGNMYVELIFAK